MLAQGGISRSIAAPSGRVKLPSVVNQGAVSSVANAFLSPTQTYSPPSAVSFKSVVDTVPKTTTTPQTVASPTRQYVKDLEALYRDQLGKDEALQGQLVAINAGGTRAAGDLSAQAQRAVAQFGEMPTGLKPDVAQYLTPETADLANAATTGGVSTVAQLNQALKKQQSADTASLAARGMLRSGAYGQHTQDNATAYTQAHYQAAQQLTDYLNGLYQNYLSAQASGQQQAYDATGQALQRIIASIQAGLVPTAYQLPEEQTDSTDTGDVDTTGPESRVAAPVPTRFGGVPGTQAAIIKRAFTNPAPPVASGNPFAHARSVAAAISPDTDRSDKNPITRKPASANRTQGILSIH